MIRRAFLTTGLGLAGTLFVPAVTAAVRPSKYRAVAFDAFPVFDPRPIAARCEALFPGRGSELAGMWRTRQFEYSWLRTLGGQYADFWRVTEDALVFAAKAMKVSLSPEQRDRLMQCYLELKAWPDVVPALVQLRAAGLRMAFLSNFTAPMLDAAIRNSGAP